MTVFGYGRHSTSGQGLTETAQRCSVDAYVTAYLNQPGVDAWMYDTALSGGKPIFERPEGLKLWALVQPGDHIVIAKLDRAFRRTLDGLRVIEMLETKGVYFHCVQQKVDTYSSTGRAILTVLLAFAQLEREQAGERTKEALAVKRNAGLPSGPASPVGWKKVGVGKDSRFVPDMAERDQALVIAGLRSAGWSYDRIVLKMRGTRRPNGAEWNRNSVAKAVTAVERRFPKSVTAKQPRASAAT
jgi:DNA invertase Pin-like site-specific DNA recombinase